MLAGAEVFRVASRPITPLGAAAVVLSMAALAIVLTRSQRSHIVLAFIGAYVARRVGLQSGFIKWLDHRVLEHVSETFDNIEGWLVAFAACSAVLVTFHVRRQQRPTDGRA